MQILGTFQSRDAAEAVKDALRGEGIDVKNMIVMSNMEAPEPPEAAVLEPGLTGAGGFAGLEEKVGKVFLSMTKSKEKLDGDGFEGDSKGGALLGVTVAGQAEADRVMALLKRHFASDIEIAQPD